MKLEERIHPELRQAFAMMPAGGDLFADIETARKMTRDMFAMMQQASDPNIPISEIRIPGEDGNQVPLRIYRPADRKGSLPGLLWIHGGGYVFGFAAMFDDLCRQFVREVNCVVVSVDYRLAPEHPFPAGLNDCYAALKWMAAADNGLDIDATRIAVAGGSAGGGLTAAVALLARDKGGPAIKLQMPLYPMIDDRNVTPSSYEFTDARLWNRETNIKAWQLYLGDKGGEVSPYAAPARAEDLSGLPPTYTIVGELDLFRDETIDYVQRLLQAGVATEFHIYPGCYHGFESVPGTKIGKKAIDGYISALKEAFALP